MKTISLKEQLEDAKYRLKAHEEFGNKHYVELYEELIENIQNKIRLEKLKKLNDC
jgi:hypothetical protein